MPEARSIGQHRKKYEELLEWNAWKSEENAKRNFLAASVFNQVDAEVRKR
jgi:hypothetical protein